MVAALDGTPVPEGFVRLAASAPLHVDPDRVALTLLDDLPWPAASDSHVDAAGLRRFEVDLRLRIGSASAGVATFSKAAYLDLGRPRRTKTGWEVEISWRAARAAPLFPVFSGWLTFEGSELRIDGLYAPPGGIVGRVADRMLLHIAANGTARWLLGEIDRAAMDTGG